MPTPRASMASNGRGRRARRRTADRGRCRGVRRRHPAEHRAREGRGPLRQSRRRGRRSSADQRRQHLCARRMRRASRHLLRPGRAGLRAGAACWRGILRAKTAAYQGSVVATNLKVSGVSVFSAGDFLGADGSESHSAQRRQARHLQEARDRGRQADRRGADRRYLGCALVSRHDPRPQAGRCHPQGDDVRPLARDRAEGCMRTVRGR